LLCSYTLIQAFEAKAMLHDPDPGKTFSQGQNQHHGIEIRMRVSESVEAEEVRV
jgi:hypothetical protein